MICYFLWRTVLLFYVISARFFFFCLSFSVDYVFVLVLFWISFNLHTSQFQCFNNIVGIFGIRAVGLMIEYLSQIPKLSLIMKNTETEVWILVELLYARFLIMLHQFFILRVENILLVCFIRFYFAELLLSIQINAGHNIMYH